MKELKLRYILGDEPHKEGLYLNKLILNYIEDQYEVPMEEGFGFYTEKKLTHEPILNPEHVYRLTRVSPNANIHDFEFQIGRFKCWLSYIKMGKPDEQASAENSSQRKILGRR